MLTEERHKKILEIIDKKGSVNAQELMVALDASESTIRRDITTLANEKKLIKVHGGAIKIERESFSTKDDEVLLRKERNMKEKIAIAKLAASLIEDDDFVYLDAGTSTGVMIDFLTARNPVFVTNAIEHARDLTRKGYKVYLIGGEYKSATEAIVGEEAALSLQKYHFTKGFFGANGISIDEGLTTPEIKEAMIKKTAIAATKQSYFLLDHTKFGEISAITFADITEGTIVTDKVPNEEYREKAKILEVE